MGVATTRSTPRPANLQLFLSLSPASKVIAKGGSQWVRLDGNAFQCRTCGRRFATFQALGGHRTSHKRPRVRANGLDLMLGAHPGRGAATPVHRCHTCSKVFPTGQALGGHMRRHRMAFDAAALETTSEEGDDDNDAAGLLPNTLIQFI